MAEEVTLKLLSLNCWGIPYVSRNRKERMKAIAEELSSGNHDIVCLQEIWSIKDYKMIKATVQEKLPHSHYFHSGVVGSGVCIYSRYPIQDVMFHRWSLNGYVHKIHHADWFGGKGLGLCRLKVNNANVNVYIAHLHAEYNTENDEYSAWALCSLTMSAKPTASNTDRKCSSVLLLGGTNSINLFNNNNKLEKNKTILS